MRVPILIGLLLASAWTACAQDFPANGQLPTSTVSNPNTAATTTSSPTAPTDDVFVFDAFPLDGQERLYDRSQQQTISPIIQIKKLTSSYVNIKLWIRNDDGDTVADTITGVSNASGSEKGLISVITAGENLKNVRLNFDNIVAIGDGHAFFLVLQANNDVGIPNMDGEGFEDIAFSPLFGVVNDETSSTSFQAKDISNSEPAKIEDGSPSGASETTSNNALNHTATAATSSSSKSKSKSGGGLATGAIAGIAVGAAVVLIVVIAAIWIILRRRKQQAHSRHADAATPLAAGYGGAAAAAGSRDFMGEKEAGAIIAESPESQAYTDQPDPRHSTLSGAAIIGGATAAPANASYTESNHQTYDEPVPAGHSPTDQQPPHHSSASGIHDVASPVPSASVARHLVDEDMTADEIARLEEEERELDRQIQEAGRRRQ